MNCYRFPRLCATFIFVGGNFDNKGVWYDWTGNTVASCKSDYCESTMELRTEIGVLSHKLRKKGVDVSLDHRKAEFNDVTNVIVVSPSPSHYFAMNFKGDVPITKVCADNDSLPACVETVPIQNLIIKKKDTTASAP